MGGCPFVVDKQIALERAVGQMIFEQPVVEEMFGLPDIDTPSIHQSRSMPMPNWSILNWVVIWFWSVSVPHFHVSKRFGKLAQGSPNRWSRQGAKSRGSERLGPPEVTVFHG